MKIGIIDAELADQKVRNRFPNLACMKLSTYHKTQGHDVDLLLNYDDIDKYEKVYISSVFTKTVIPEGVINKSNVEFGGTGFYYDKYDSSPMLPYDIEHSKPDYDLYASWVVEQKRLKELKKQQAKNEPDEHEESSGTISDTELKYYTDYSIGFTTRGCTRGCIFCVNRNSTKVFPASKIEEFYDPRRKKLCLLDDNILAYSKDWRTIWEQLIKKTEEDNSCFEYKQGMDIRLMNDETAALFAKSRYCGDFIFAFDNPKDEKAIRKGLSIFRKHIPEKSTKLYVFCGFDSQDEKDIETVFQRTLILWEYKCLSYVMRHENYEGAKEPYRNMYVQLARWCNQPGFQKKLPFREFCERSKGKAARLMNEFEQKHPEFKKYFDAVCPFANSSFLEANQPKIEGNAMTVTVPDVATDESESIKEIHKKYQEIIMIQASALVNRDRIIAEQNKKIKALQGLSLPKDNPKCEVCSVPEEPLKETPVKTEPVKEPKKKALEELKITDAIKRTLIKKGFDTVDKICAKTKEEFGKTPSWRSKSTVVVEDALKAIGKGFRQDTAPPAPTTPTI